MYFVKAFHFNSGIAIMNHADVSILTHVSCCIHVSVFQSCRIYISSAFLGNTCYQEVAAIYTSASSV